MQFAYLGGAAGAAGRESAGGLVGTGVAGHGEAALVAAVRLPAAVAFLAGLDDAVAADGRLRLSEAAAAAARLGRQHRADRVQAARRELVVVALVARGGAREHDVVAVLAARRAVFRVVLKISNHFHQF